MPDIDIKNYRKTEWKINKFYPEEETRTVLQNSKFLPDFSLIIEERQVYYLNGTSI